MSRRPTSVALACGEEEVTYGELARRTDRLAHRLRGLGVGPEVLVGVCLDRSPDLVVTLLGVLKVGGAYLPLDPTHPIERLAGILEDSQASVVLTERRFMTEPWLGGVERLELGGEGAMGAEESPLPFHVGAGPENLAYVIYTSGSTGRPKGVQITRGALDNFLLSMAREPGLDEGDRLLAVTTPSFDIAALELFLPLTVGARVVLASREEAMDATRLAARLACSAATVMQATPATWRLLLESGWTPERPLRALCGGEALPLDVAERLLARCASLWNLYGPTETTVWSCIARVESAAPPLSIGRPIRNTRILLLDADGQPTPPGAAGELCIAGQGLARGYFQRPDLTAERFIPCPSGGEQGERVYRTGDLARWLPDGTLELLGRIDHQIKVRGFRIEPAEIEAELVRHPAVRSAVVVAWGGDGEEKRLVAYYAADAGAEPPVSELRALIGRRLPAYMVPSVFVRLDELPLTPNRKIDRRRLPAPDLARQALDVPQAAPQGELERQLVELWSDVLGVGEVGVLDDFFTLGGDSIRGALLINRLQRELGEPLYVMSLFEASTPAGLAGHLRQHYGRAVARRFPDEAGAVHLPAEDSGAVGPAEVAEMRSFLAARSSAAVATSGGAKNPPAVLILSPPRAGSTLLRVMLAGHPRLFSPPELHLLAWETMMERRAALSGRESFAAEGLLRAVMEIEGCGAAAAAERIQELEARGATTGEAYRWLQERIGGRTLVDKTPTYALDPAALRRAERVFDGAFYLHLTRHPTASVRSYVESRMDRVYGLPFDAERQAELVWLISHENIEDFLAGVPRRRWLRLCFEDLVRNPRGAMEQVCRLLGIEPDPRMLQPYEGRRMTEGPHGASRMTGDPRFFEHREIDPAMAELRLDGEAVPLGELTWRRATALGYERQGPRPVEIGRIPRGAALPLSFAQERLWFLDRLLPGSAAYNVPLDLRLAGDLAPAALEAALTEIARRHEALRASFPATEGKPMQRIAEPAPWPLPHVDLSSLPPAVRQAEARRLAREEGRLPFDLARGPLARGLLLRLESREHRLLLTVHHIVCDGWSRVLLLNELAALCSAAMAGRPSPFPELPVQYLDFAHWQRERLRGERLESQLGYWRERLDEAPVLALPADRPRPAMASSRGVRRPVRLPATLVARVRESLRDERATLFMAVTAAFFALLRRYSGQRDLLVGAAVAGRNHADVEGLIGLFANTVVLRAEVDDETGFGGLLAQVRGTVVEAFAHQDIPFEKLVQELQPERDLSRNPLFQAALTLHGAPLPHPALQGLSFQPLEVDTGTAKLDLSLQLAEEEGALTGFLEISLDLFDADVAVRCAEHLRTLLAAAVERPAARIADLPLLSPPEHHQILIEWNKETGALAAGPWVHHRFETQAQAAPDALAVAAVDTRLSYGELNARANRLARHLRSLGVDAETPVAICLERSADLVTAALAVLKAGAAYLPLDPGSPAERLAWVLADASARVVISRAPLGLDGVEQVDPEANRERLAVHAATDLGTAVDGAQLAYVIYTSGSTGRPKGVAVSHAALANLIDWHRHAYGLTPADRGSLLASPAFDASVWEVWPYLASGASLHVPDADTAASPQALVSWLAAAGVTVGFLATPLAEAALIEPWPAGARLRSLLTGGDRLRRGPAAGLPFPLINHYGPTENAVVATAGEVAAGDSAPPIGRPIDGVRAHLLDAALQPVPVGVPGELCLGGAGLARGYLGRPDLTAERFVPDPLGAATGARLYRTGDLVRWRRDGTLEFLGRFDHQVKIRGFRIELGEIETVLAAVPGVCQAVVVVRSDGADRSVGSAEHRLVAYVTGEATAAELRDFLAARLPAYMVPAAIVPLESLPLTPQGKIDRRALPEPPAETAATGLVLPRNAVEEVVAGVW
ncbi:MAG: amino acid adenylation domain-containing protein, partial [Thermoanaerobaculia bacterium]